MTETRSTRTGNLLYNSTLVFTDGTLITGSIQGDIDLANAALRDCHIKTYIVSIKEKPHTDEELTEKAAKEERAARMKVGIAVINSKYGYGVVTEVNGNIVTIRFKDGEIRKFDMKYASLSAFKIVE